MKIGTSQPTSNQSSTGGMSKPRSDAASQSFMKKAELSKEKNESTNKEQSSEQTFDKTELMIKSELEKSGEGGIRTLQDLDINVVSMRDLTQGERAFMKAVAKRFGASSEDIKKIDNMKVKVVFAEGSTTNGIGAQGFVLEKKINDFQIMVLDNRAKAPDYSGKKLNQIVTISSEKVDAQLLFAHEATHILQYSGIIPYTASPDKVFPRVTDDYNYKPELELGLRKEELSSEDQATYVEEFFTELLYNPTAKIDEPNFPAFEREPLNPAITKALNDPEFGLKVEGMRKLTEGERKELRDIAKNGNASTAALEKLDDLKVMIVFAKKPGSGEIPADLKVTQKIDGYRVIVMHSRTFRPDFSTITDTQTKKSRKAKNFFKKQMSSILNLEGILTDQQKTPRQTPGRTSIDLPPGITSPDDFTPQQKIIAEKGIEPRYKNSEVIGMREPTKGELEYLKTIAKKFGAGETELKKVDNVKVMIAFATGPNGMLVNKNGRSIAGAVVAPNKDGYTILILNAEYIDIDYSSSRDNGFKGQRPLASGIFAHEATHILQRAGAIPFTPEGEEQEGQEDDYDFKPEIKLGIPKEKLTREDQAEYVRKNYADLLVDKGSQPNASEREASQMR